MVHHVTQPKQVYLMAHAMRPIVKEVDPDKGDDYPIPSVFQGENSKILVDKSVGSHGENFGENARELLHDSTTYICHGIIESVYFPIFKIAISYLHPYQDKENGYGEYNGIDVHS
jgi:hypothetical protein